jgi:hypothetical protein
MGVKYNIAISNFPNLCVTQIKFYVSDLGMITLNGQTNSTWVKIRPLRIASQKFSPESAVEVNVSFFLLFS